MKATSDLWPCFDLVGGLLRLLPHLPTWDQWAGFSLFAGARLRGWQSLCDTRDHNSGDRSHHGKNLRLPCLYAGHTLCLWQLFDLCLDRLPSANNREPLANWRGCLAGEWAVFLITNFGMWLSGISFYPLTVSGLMACYLGGIPYLGRTLASDLAYAGLLFGLHAWLTRVALPQERVRENAEVVAS